MGEPEDALIRKILAVSFSSDQPNALAQPPVLLLAGLAEELASEQHTHTVLMTKDTLDRIIVNRLIESPPEQYPQPPFQYLLGCFSRAVAELRSLSSKQDAAVQQQLQSTIVACKDLLLSYSALILSGSGVVPEPEAASQRGALQLLDSIDACDPAGGAAAAPGAAPAAAAASGEVTPLPPGFLEELAAQQDLETLEQIMAPVVRELARRVSVCSPLGAYSAPLAAIKHLVSVEPMAQALAALPSFLPDLAASTGRAAMLPGACWLGACFVVSAVPDQGLALQPNVMQQCFQGILTGTRRQADAERNIHTLRMAGKHITGELTAIVKALLGKATRERMLQWLGAVIEGNNERAKMQANIMVAASHGFFCNLDAVLLKLCGPFLDPNSGKAFMRIDASYVTLGKRLNFKEDSKLAATQPEAAALIEKQQQQQQQQDVSFHFICESFFMTLKALHLGLIKLISTVTDEQQFTGQQLAEMQAASEEAVRMAAGTPGEALAQQQQQRVRNAADIFQAAQLCYTTVLGDVDLVEECLAFYRLVARWILLLVSPSGQPQLPLPEQVPPAFALLPEWFVEDIAEYLLYITRFHYRLLANQRLDDLMLFMVIFMGSPQYIRNPYLRSKLSEVVHAWLPQGTESTSFVRSRASQLEVSLAPLFEADPLVVGHLVPSLLSLYADVEHTDRANQFYLKFNMRQHIGDVLMYCWRLEEHRRAWKAYASLAGGRGPYLRFANMLINDATWLLDEALKKLQELREQDTQLASSSHLPPHELQERQQQLRQTGGQIKSLFYLASGVINTLATSTTEVAGPFLLPEMVERLAAMLNYFLLYLTGPQRKALKVKDPEKYNFNPKQLLSQICRIYLNMAAADRAGVFAAAIAADGRSYRPEMFAEASLVLRQFGLLPEMQVQLLERLGDQVAQAAAEGQAEEEVMGDVPDEFLDPILSTLMKDPVILPTSGNVVDRATIMRHLLSDEHDPFNRMRLTPDMLQPATEVKARIKAWLKEQQANKMQQ